MDDKNQDLAKQYQDILDHYSRELSDQKEPTPSAPPAETLLLPPVTPPPAPTYSISTAPVETTPQPSNLFKYLFFLSLLIFLGVFGTIAYTVFFSANSQDLASAEPTTAPNVETTPTTASIDAVCEVNDKKYNKGESFLAADKCNTCVCGADLTISCTEKACEATPSVKATSTTKTTPTVAKKQLPKTQKLPIDLTTFVKFQIIKQSTSPITESQVKIGESLLIGNYAQVAANGTVIWAFKDGSSWKLIANGQEPPKCSVLAPDKFPTDFDCQN